jgi:XisH protein
LYVDLGAELVIAAENAGRKIAVEIQSFVGQSDIDDLEKALGQYTLYNDILAEREPERVLYLAVRNAVYIDLFEEPIGKLLLAKARLKLIVFDPRTEVILKWIP